MEAPKPRPYQQKVIEAALPHYGFALFLEQRVGKTLTSLWLAQKWGCETILIICPKKAIPVWHKEIKLVGLPAKGITVIGFEAFRIAQKKGTFPLKYDLLIVDESHRIKERSSQQTKACWAVGKHCQRRLILSGSPQGNGMEDYYAQLRLIRPDIFPTWKAFSERYLIIENKWRQGMDDPFPQITGYKNQDEFKQILKSISYRVTRDEVAAVKTLVRVRKHCIPSGEALQRHYKELEKELMTVISGELITAPIILTKSLKLHQFCGGFVKDDDGTTHHFHSDKLNYLWGLVEGPLKDKSYVIVAQYKAEMDTIAQGLAERNITHVQIRGGNKYQYNPDDRSQVTILQPSSGEAINLAHHDQMVIYSMNHSYLKWTQFKDRIVVVDTPEVQYHYLIMQGLMDEIVFDSVREKKKLSDEVFKVYGQDSKSFI